jgi:hypothetical protein
MPNAFVMMRKITDEEYAKTTIYKMTLDCPHGTTEGWLIIPPTHDEAQLMAVGMDSMTKRHKLEEPNCDCTVGANA